MSKDWVLGFAAEESSSAEASWYDTRIGGVPVWPQELDVAVPPCPRCAAQRLLVLQAYAPHQKHLERVLYIFGCNSIICSAEAQTWWAVRLCKVDDEGPAEGGSKNGPRCERQAERKAEVAPLVERGDSIDWDTDSDADASSESDVAGDLALLSLEVELAAAKKEASALSDHRKQSRQSHPRASVTTAKRGRPGAQRALQRSEKVPSPPCADPSTFRQPFASYYVEVGFEPSASKPLVEQTSVHTLLQKYMEEENSRAASGTNEAWAPEKEDEESSARHHHDDFLERIARAPAQILRYKFGGQPLWPKYPSPEVDPDARCDCGSHLVFELQVLGSCLHYLQPERSVPDLQAEAGMNFASVAVFTCAADCTAVDTVADNGLFKVISQTAFVQLDDW